MHLLPQPPTPAEQERVRLGMTARDFHAAGRPGLRESLIAGPVMARIRIKIHRLVPFFAIVALAGCGTVPPPTDLMARAAAQIRAAHAADAATLAPEDFAEAQRRFDFAQQSLSQGNNEQATASAEEADAAAETARAKARAADLERQIQSKRDENAGLQSDLEQHQTAAAQAQSAAQAPSSAMAPEELPPIQLGGGNAAAPEQGEIPAAAPEQGEIPAAGSSAGMIPPPIEPPSASSDGEIQGNDEDGGQGGTR